MTSERVDRRQALRIGGLTVSIAAVAAACGTDREGDTSPGRVGFAPPITEPPNYSVDDAVLLRTASSLELSFANAYRQMLALDEADEVVTEYLELFIENHEAVAEEMGELAESVGGEAWACPNDWFMDRAVAPILAAIVGSDDPARDIFDTVVAFENLGAATHQTNVVLLDDPDAAQASLEAAKLESRQSAAIVAAERGPEGYVSPALEGAEVPVDENGVPLQFSITHRTGSTGQIELVVGAPDENGVRETFILQTPAENSFVYNELAPIC